MRGVAPNVKLMALKFLNSGGSGTTAAAIEAIEYAASFGVPITNNSWSGGRKSRALENAIRDAGALFVAAAGNNGASKAKYPAGYGLDNIISVAATDHNDALASFSNYGSSWVDLAAPGVNILSTTPGNNYGFKNGTSMACPHVAGVAALVMAQFPSLDVAGVKNTILSSGGSSRGARRQDVDRRALECAGGGRRAGSSRGYPSPRRLSPRFWSLPPRSRSIRWPSTGRPPATTA